MRLHWVGSPRIFQRPDLVDAGLMPFREGHQSTFNTHGSSYVELFEVKSDLFGFDGYQVKLSNAATNVPCAKKPQAEHPTNIRSILNEDVCGCYEETNGIANFHWFAGDPSTTALYTIEDQRLVNTSIGKINPTRKLPSLDLETVLSFLRTPYVMVDRLIRYLESLPSEGSVSCLDKIGYRSLPSRHYMRSLEKISVASEIYADLSPATISMAVVSRPFHQARWHYASTYEEIFSCIAMLESGIRNIEPQQLNQVMAMSSGNSIFVATPLLQDPFHSDQEVAVKRIVGNLGHAGISMLIPPPAPRIRAVDPSRWRAVQHKPFDGQLKDHFKATTTHLSFTQYEVLLVSGELGRVDAEAVLLESLLSVHDSGEWVADLDIIGAFRAINLLQRVPQPNSGFCRHVDSGTGSPDAKLVSIDRYEELIDSPEDLGHRTLGIVRTQDNWLARLAATAMSIQQGLRTLVFPSAPTICWHCAGQVSFYKFAAEQEGDIPVFSRLPPQILIL